MSWLDEALLVLAYSTRTQLAIVMGVVVSCAILIYGHFAVEQFELTGLMAPLTEVIRPYFEHRYDTLALGSLFSFFGLAAKAYRKDRKRLLGM